MNANKIDETLDYIRFCLKAVATEKNEMKVGIYAGNAIAEVEAMRVSRLRELREQEEVKDDNLI